MMKLTFLIFSFLIGFNLFGQNSPYSQILENITDKNFFKAKELLNQHESKLNGFQKEFVGAYISTAFNQLETSQKQIKNLISNSSSNLSRKNIADLYNLQHENALKLYDYKLAKKSIEIILNDYSDVISEEKKADYENSLKIAKALENIPRQEVIFKGSQRIKMTKDQVGLNNLPVASQKDSAHFIFDTGANLSTTIRSVAERFNMKFLNGEIEVGTITGKTVNARLAVCKELKMENVLLKNVVFLVFEDEDLAFSQINYQIYGILGYPVIEAFKEIQITKDGYFNIPETETKLEGESNLALDNLLPIIEFQGKHFSFDTGATNSMLYFKYFVENKDFLEQNHEKSQVQLGGAGGAKVFESYKIDFPLKVNGKDIFLKKIDVLTADEDEKWKQLYGNLGQDLIGQFDKMTINFDQMFVRFD